MRDFHFQLRTPNGLQSSAITICCEGPEIAFMEACRIIPGIAGEMLREGEDPLACEFVIRNATGEEMFTVPFSELIRPVRARH